MSETTATTTATPSTEATQPEVKTPKPRNVSGIPDSRVKRYFDEMYVNKEVHLRSEQVRAELAPFNRARNALDDGLEEQFANGKVVLDENRKVVKIPLGDARRVELKDFLTKRASDHIKLEQEHQALSRARTRFSEDAARKVRDISVLMVSQLLEHAAKNCLKVDKKIMQVSHLHAEGWQSLGCSPLWEKLPSWVNPPILASKKTKTGSDETAAAAETTDDDSHKNKPSFVYYITEMCCDLTHPLKVDEHGEPVLVTVERKNEKTGAVVAQQSYDRQQDGPYALLRTSTQFKQYLSDLVFEFFGRIAPLIQLQLNVLKIKTIDSTVIMNVVQFIMTDGHPATEKLVYEQIDKPDPEVLRKVKLERKAARDEKREPNDKRKDTELPQVKVLDIRKEVVVDCPKYEQLCTALNEAQKLWPTKETRAK